MATTKMQCKTIKEVSLKFWLCLDYFVSIEVLKLLEWAAALSPKGIKLNKEDIDGGTEQVQVNN